MYGLVPLGPIPELVLAGLDFLELLPLDAPPASLVSCDPILKQGCTLFVSNRNYADAWIFDAFFLQKPLS